MRTACEQWEEVSWVVPFSIELARLRHETITTCHATQVGRPVRSADQSREWMFKRRKETVVFQMRSSRAAAHNYALKHVPNEHEKGKMRPRLVPGRPKRLGDRMTFSSR